MTPNEKRHSQMDRLGFALAGLRSAWVKEASFRTEVVVGAIVLAAMAWHGYPLFAWVAVLFALALALSAELMNTAIEHVCDALHPERHAFIKIAKDCASAGVLVANLSGLLVLAVLVFYRG